ncbi:hypothetical protein Tco_1037324 [Tanacetum coccineum]
MEAYVDDMVIKSMDEEGHTTSKQGIKANSAKNQALTSLKRPKTIKEVQSLNSKLADLDRFLSKIAEKCIPFFEMLKGCLEKKDFTWTREADKAFEEMKSYIEKIPTLVVPKARGSLIIYLASSRECIGLRAQRIRDRVQAQKRNQSTSPHRLLGRNSMDL